MKLSEWSKLTKEERKTAGFKQMPAILKASLWVIVVMPFLIIGIICSTPQSKTQRPVVENSALDGSVRQVKEYLKANLKDWDSYEGVDWSPVKMIDSTQKRYWVRHKYRAKNSFGGYVLENQLFSLDSTGQVIEVLPYE